MGEENAVVVGVGFFLFPLVFFWTDFLQLTWRRGRRWRAGVWVIAEFHSFRSDTFCTSPCFPVVYDPSDGLLGDAIAEGCLIKTSSFHKRSPGFVVLLLFFLVPSKRIFGVGSLFVLV